MQHGWNLCTSDRVLCLKVLCGMSTDVRTGIPGIWELVTACSLTLIRVLIIKVTIFNGLLWVVVVFCSIWKIISAVSTCPT